MLKILGAVLIVFAATAAGFIQARRYSSRPSEIRRLILSLQRLGTEIEYGFIPLPDALKRIGSQNREPLKRIFLDAAVTMESPHQMTAQDSIHRSIQQNWKHTSMKNPERDVLYELAFTMGTSDRSSQKGHLESATRLLEAEEALALEDQRRYEKASKSLGLLIGAFIVILIY